MAIDWFMYCRFCMDGNNLYQTSEKAIKVNKLIVKIFTIKSKYNVIRCCGLTFINIFTIKSIEYVTTGSVLSPI